MRIVMAGSSGFLGTALRRHLAGHDIVRLVRSEPQGPDQVRWDPDQGQLDPEVLHGADAVINLAGAGVEDHRWTEAYKRTLVTSRLNPTTTLAKAMAALDGGPRILLNASAKGYYNDGGDTILDEDTPNGDHFLAELCRDWEAATQPAADAGIRVVLLRTGYPLDRSGGFLKPQVILFKLFGGARLSDGKHWLPWISLSDWNRAVEFTLTNDSVSGPVNLSGPNPARNAEFTKALAKVLHRPAFMMVPRFALNIALGGLAQDALASQRLRPRVLEEKGFEFEHPELMDALRVATVTRD